MSVPILPFHVTYYWRITSCYHYVAVAMYKGPAVREPSLSRLKEIAQDLGLDVEETELQAYQSMT